MTVDLDTLTPGYWRAGDPDKYRAVIEELRDARTEIQALRRALADVEVLAREGSETIYAAAELARMVRTNSIKGLTSTGDVSRGGDGS